MNSNEYKDNSNSSNSNYSNGKSSSNKTRHRLLKAILMFVITIISITTISSSVPAWAEGKKYEIKNFNALTMLNEIADKEARMIAISLCVPSAVPGNGYPAEESFESGTSLGASKEVGYSLRNVFVADGRPRRLGQWIAKEVLGSGGDGKVFCLEDESDEKHPFLKFVANTLSGGDEMKIVCNRDNSELPGLVNALDYKDSDKKYYRLPGECKEPFSGYGSLYNGFVYFKDWRGANGNFKVGGMVYGTGSEYLGNLYKLWAMEKGYSDYITPWDDLKKAVEMFVPTRIQPKYLGYYVDYQEFVLSGCVTMSNVPETRKAESGVYEIKELSYDGSVSKKYIVMENVNINADQLSQHKNTSCEGLWSRMRDNFDAWRGKLKEIYRRECHKRAKPAWEFELAKAKAVLGKEPKCKDRRCVVYRSGLGAVTVTKEDFDKAYNSNAEFKKLIDEYNNKGAEKNQYIWKNYEDETGVEIQKADGTTETVDYPLLDISEEDKVNAQKTEKSYQELPNDDHHGKATFEDPTVTKGVLVTEIDYKAFICHLPENYEFGEPPADADPNQSEPEKTCENRMALGWMVCPLLRWMNDFTDMAYREYVKPNLKVEATLFTKSATEGGTYKAWQTFQGIANTIFVIILLFVIFSQLTGVGIDNYGIKKILPKLIVVAVLVNLSYIICLACVDISNILGGAFQDFFDSFKIGATQYNLGDADKESNAGGVVAIVILGAIFGVAIAISPGIILTMLIALLGLIIAVFFLFILLAGRKALIILLTVTAPVAIVCYALPNTKKLYDKWMKLWTTMLILYPVCGLLVGVGNFASRLMLATGGGTDNEENGYKYAFTAMLIGIVPIFFIPTLVKGSFAALGALSSKITGFGDRMKGGATSKLKNTDTYKNAKAKSAQHKQRLFNQWKAGGRIKTKKDGTTEFVPYTKHGLRLPTTKNARGEAMRALSQGYATKSGNKGFDAEHVNANLAALETKEREQTTADYEASLKAGRIPGVSATDTDSMSKEYARLIGIANDQNKSASQRRTATDQARAIQNQLMKSEGGREEIRNNLDTYGNSGAAKDLAGFLMNDHASEIKSADRGAFSMYSAIANGKFDSKKDYSLEGLDKLSAESLAGMDIHAVNRLIESVNKPGNEAQLEQLQGLIAEARNSQNIHIKEEVEKAFNSINSKTTGKIGFSA